MTAADGPATDPLEPRAIGTTGVTVTRFGFGGTTLGGRHVYSDVGEAQAVAAVHAAFAAGVRYFDTAPFYGAGEGERRMGLALQDLPRAAFALSTKVGYTLRDGAAPVLDFSCDATLRSFEASLARLKVEAVEVAFVHDADKGPYFAKALRGAYPALRRLREEGRVRAIGVGVADWRLCREFARAAEFDVFMLACRYTLLEQGGALHEFLPFCRERGIAVIAAAPFASGILATGAVPGARHDHKPATAEALASVREIEAVCAAHGVALPAAALQFPLAHPDVTAMVVGSRSAKELACNLDLVRRPVPPAFWSELKARGLIDGEAPVPGSGPLQQQDPA